MYLIIYLRETVTKTMKQIFLTLLISSLSVHGRKALYFYIELLHAACVLTFKFNSTEDKFNLSINYIQYRRNMVQTDHSLRIAPNKNLHFFLLSLACPLVCIKIIILLRLAQF